MNFNLEKKRLQGEVTAAIQHLKVSLQGSCRGSLSGHAANTRNNGSRLKDGRFRLVKNFFLISVRAGRHWHRLLREVVGALSLKVFKTRLDGTHVFRLQPQLHLKVFAAATEAGW